MAARRTTRSKTPTNTSGQAKPNSTGVSMQEVGVSGLEVTGGVVMAEFLPQLRGAYGRKTLREMSENDSIIGGILTAFYEVLNRLDWHIEEPEDAEGTDAEASDFIQECWEDMSDDPHTTLTSITTGLLPYGWAYHEIVYKRRLGPNDKPSLNSKFDDGRIGWRKWAPRSQQTLMGWSMDDDGGIQAMKQVTSQGTYEVPIEKSLLFRLRPMNNNPEGRSLIRSCYRPWYFKKYIEEIEAVGIERDLAGLPVIFLPESYFLSTATAAEKSTLTAMKTMVTQIKRNEVEGLVFPRKYDDKGNKLIDIELLSAAGSRQHDTDAIIARYSQAISMAVLADFLLLGHEAVGSKSLGVSKIELWMMAVESIAEAIASVINTHAIPRLLRLNGLSPENPPRMVYGTIEKTDLSALATYAKNLTDAGILIPDRKLEDHLRALADLPPVDDDDRADMFGEDGPKYGKQPAPVVAPIVDPETGEPVVPKVPSKPGAKPEKLPPAPKGEGLPNVPGQKPKAKPSAAKA